MTDKLTQAKQRLEIKRKLEAKRAKKQAAAEVLAQKIGEAYAERDVERLHKTVESVLDGIGGQLESAIADLPKPDAPIVNVETDTTELAQIAEQTKAELEALQSKLNLQPTIDTIKAVQGEISGLKSQFEGITKALEQDIYARYDYANSIEENGVRYIGYLNKDSNWFIQRLGKSTEGESSTFATGKAGTYKQAWENRLMLKYVPRDKATIV